VILHAELADQRVAARQPASLAQPRRRQAVLEPPAIVLIDERQNPHDPVAVVIVRFHAFFVGFCPLRITS